MSSACSSRWRASCTSASTNPNPLHLLLLLLISASPFVASGVAVRGVRRSLHQPLYPSDSTPPPDFSGSSPPVTVPPSTPVAATPSDDAASNVETITAVAVPASLGALALLSLLAFLLYCRRSGSTPPSVPRSKSGSRVRSESSSETSGLSRKQPSPEVGPVPTLAMSPMPSPVLLPLQLTPVARGRPPSASPIGVSSDEDSFRTGLKSVATESACSQNTASPSVPRRTAAHPQPPPPPPPPPPVFNKPNLDECASFSRWRLARPLPQEVERPRISGIFDDGMSGEEALSSSRTQGEGKEEMWGMRGK